MTRQSTLFDTWKSVNLIQSHPLFNANSLLRSKFNEFERSGTKANLLNCKPVATNRKSLNGDDEVTTLIEEDDDEAFLALAIAASKDEYAAEQEKRRPRSGTGYVRTVDPEKPSTSTCQGDEVSLTGFDGNAGKFWIYPTNFPVRRYQFDIIQKALFHNTLVTLPTGLGKTFIAAVVMYNFYRWYPSGKVVFMAPTKPLVAQQVEACYNIMGIPQDDVAEMTGSIAPGHRKKLWEEKRVFFLTPQVISNDLQKSLFPAESVKCLVIDEAHKATGDHAYCQVVRELIKHTKQFRVLALSATPGSDLNAVQQVLSNLLISHMELRSEDSPEIRKYTHSRNIECIVVPLTSELREVRDKYEKVLQQWLNFLTSKRVVYAASTQNCSLKGLLASRNQFRVERPPGIKQWEVGAIEGAFTNAIGLLHGHLLLSNMGMKSLYNYFQGKISADKSTPVRRELNRNSDLREIYDFLRERFSKEESERAARLQFPGANESFFDRSNAADICSTQQVADLAATSHPKLVKLVEILIDHFKSRGSSNTRAMVFAQYRDCVEEITDLLKKQKPLIRPMKFVGQASSRATAKGISQKEQLLVVKQFKEGGYNTLVSTSVGEEGLDIGEVDLIICYDATASPVRSVQRMGRTGRKRQGRIVVLVTEGKEQNIFTSSEYNTKRVHKAILANKKFELYRHNPRMVPAGLVPQCVPMLTTREKPYENFALRKRQNCATGVNHSVKRFAGSLNEQELCEWERDFKLGDDAPSQSLEKREPLKIAVTADWRRNGTRFLSLAEYASWQDRQQPSFSVTSSSLCTTFVTVMGMCQKNLGSAPAVGMNASFTSDITPFLQSDLHGPVKRTNKEKHDKPAAKRRRRQKKTDSPSKEAPVLVNEDSCQLTAYFATLGGYCTTSKGQRLNLEEMFPLASSSSRNRSSRICNYLKKPETDNEFDILPLKSRDLLAAMKADRPIVIDAR